MTVAETRADLVSAVGGVPGLSATGYTPTAIVAYTAWVEFVTATPVNYCVREASWFVIVVLPSSSNQTTVDAGDALMDPVIDALKPLAKVLFVDRRIWPVELGQAGVPVLRFSVEA